MAAYEFIVNGDPARAKQTAIDALTARGFTVTWTDEWTAVAEKGSKVANALAGALAQYFKVGVAVRSLDDGHSVIRLERLSSGWLGGAWGANKTTRNFVTLRDELGNTFTTAGVLVAHREA